MYNDFSCLFCSLLLSYYLLCSLLIFYYLFYSLLFSYYLFYSLLLLLFVSGTTRSLSREGVPPGARAAPDLQRPPSRGRGRAQLDRWYIVENDHSKLRILVYSRLGNQRIWPFVVTATILAVIAQCDSLISTFHHTIKVQILHTTKNLRLFMRISDGAWRWTWSWTGERRTSHRWSFAFHKNEWIRRINKWS